MPMKIEGTQIHFLSDVSAEVGFLGSCKIIGISKAIPRYTGEGFCSQIINYDFDAISVT